MPMGIPVANSPVRAMDDQLDTNPLGSGPGLSDRVQLGIDEPGSALAVFAPPCLSVTMGNHMNWLGHTKPAPPIQIGNLRQAYLTGDIAWQAVRVWFGCVELLAIREAAARGRPRWKIRKRTFNEFRKEEL